MKKKKSIQIGKEAAKLSLFADDVILYDPKYSIKKVFKLPNSVKSWDTKSIHKNLLWFYILITNDQKKKLRKQSHLLQHKNEYNT